MLILNDIRLYQLKLISLNRYIKNSINVHHEVITMERNIDPKTVNFILSFIF